MLNNGRPGGRLIFNNLYSLWVSPTTRNAYLSASRTEPIDRIQHLITFCNPIILKIINHLSLIFKNLTFAMLLFLLICFMHIIICCISNIYNAALITKIFFQLIWRNVFRSRTTRDCFCAFICICSFIVCIIKKFIISH